MSPLRGPGKDRWQLTAEALDCLLKGLHADAQAAGERYGRLQQRLILFFMRHQCVTPEDLADEVLNRLANLLLANRAIDNIEAFSLGIARMVLLEERACIRKEERTHQEVVRNMSNQSHTSIESERELDAMEAHLAALPPQAQQLLAAYHTDRGTVRIKARQQLAASLGISMGTLRKRVFDLQLTLRRKLSRTVADPAAAPEVQERRHH